MVHLCMIVISRGEKQDVTNMTYSHVEKASYIAMEKTNITIGSNIV